MACTTSLPRKTRFFDFDESKMADDISLHFREALCSFCGMTTDEPTGLLSSLPNELIFNDLRDARRRARKAEATAPCNMHACSLKSCQRRPHGCGVLELDQEDWCSPLKGKQIRAKVHDATKPKDVELGINCHGLTRHKSNTEYTKPHVFCQRLRLLQLLQKVWDEAAGDLEQRGEAVWKAYKQLWTSKLIPTQCFIKWSGCEDGPSRNMVLA